MSSGPRPPARRRLDTEERLAHDADVWVATSSPEGVAHLVPLSFAWDGEALIVATPADSRTARNLAATGSARLGLGETRDVTMIDGDVEVFEIDELAPHLRECFVSRTGWDPAAEAAPHRWFRISPRQIQAWREVDELAGRTLMRDGRWQA